MGVYQFIGSIGTMIYSKAGGYIHDSYGPEYPFIIVGSLDVILVILLVSFAISGKLDH